MSESTLVDRAAVLLSELREENDRLRADNTDLRAANLRLAEALRSVERNLAEFLRANGVQP